MTSYLLDTNHLGLAVNADSPVCERLDSQQSGGDQFGTCLPVICELEVGIQNVSRPDAYRNALYELLRYFRLWSVDLETAGIYGILYHELRNRGRALSQVDMMVSSLARQHHLTVLTTDRDFEALPDIPTEDWTH